MSKKLSQDVLAREKEVRPFIEEYSELFDIDPNLVRALITQESLFKGDARSPTGALGFGQFTAIAAKQVQNIATTNELARDLKDFSKQEASNPDRGIKAICATLWWLFYVKYKGITDKKTQVEAVLTFYNAGGRPAALVVKKGGHAAALAEINALPSNQRSQASTYAPSVLEWFLLWHEHFTQVEKEEVSTEEVVQPLEENKNPFVEPEKEEPVRDYSALVESLLALGKADENIAVAKQNFMGLTEVRIILNGKY